MFIGSINENLRSILAEMAVRWKGRRVYVGCSGNATVERIIAPFHPAEIHGNDISLYSCALGGHLAGSDVAVTINDPAWEWLVEYLTPGIDTIATLLMCTEMFKYADRDELFHRRMIRGYRSQWKNCWTKTRERIGKSIGGLKLTSFFAGDVLDFCQAAPADCVFITFPPTYNGGYERLYKKLDQVFEWERPSYTVFNDARYAQLVASMQEKSEWVTLRDHDVTEFKEFLKCRIQTTPRARPVYVYSGGNSTARVVVPHQKVEALPVKRLEGELAGDLRLMRITGGQMNGLRSQYLAPTIAPAAATQNYGVLVGNQLIGAFSFSPPTLFGGFCDTYMMTDLAIRPSSYKRLSKLVLVAVLSTEARALCEMQQNGKVKLIGTTAFTEKAVSQKYRGLFHIYSRKPGALNYIAEAGRWNLDAGFAWWKDRHGQRKEEENWKMAAN